MLISLRVHNYRKYDLLGQYKFTDMFQESGRLVYSVGGVVLLKEVKL